MAQRWGVATMKLRTHTCRATGCQKVISGGMLMCLDHWRMVPAPLRREIVGSIEGSYRNAVARAVAAVAEKQERKAQASAGPSGSLFT